MFSTPASLLHRLNKPGDGTAWDNFVEIYSPLLFHWARCLGQQDSDAADLVQDVFLLLLRKLPAFEYDPQRSFHAWLKTLFLNQQRLRARGRTASAAQHDWHEFPDRPAADPDDTEHRTYLTRQVFRMIEREFSPLQQKAFRAYTLLNHSPQVVADDLGITVGTVYAIKSKVLSRLREELRQLLD